jgi:hypothetical protein
MAVNNCATQNKSKLPPGYGQFRGSSAQSGFVHLLPYLDADVVYKGIISGSSGATPLKVLQATNDVSHTGNTETSYALNDAVFPGATVQGTATNVTTAGTSTSFRTDKEFANGTGNSLIAIERSAVCGLIGILPGTQATITHRYHHDVAGTIIQSRNTFNGSLIVPVIPDQIRPAIGKANDNYSQAFTTSGFNSLMADGRVVGVSANVNPEVLIAVQMVKSAVPHTVGTTQITLNHLSAWDD